MSQLNVFHPLLFVVLAALASPCLRADGQFSEIDALFTDYGAGTPGCALGVMRDGEFAYRQGYGMANLEHDIPLTPSSVFRIGSTSKQFTAAAIALLAERGQIRLDDPIAGHFPEFPAWANEITVMNLVNHSSGIRDYLQLTWLQGLVNDADYYSDDYVIELLARQQETNFPPGTEYLYSNSGYLLLAQLVQRVSGQSLKEYAAANIFGPLGMADSHFHDDHTHIVPGRASGYAPREDGFRISQTTLDMVGDGGVYTSVDDLLSWERNFAANRLGGGDDFIDLLTTPGTFRDGRPMDYAFGLAVETYRGLDVVHHGGAFVGYRAMFMRFPAERLALTLLCNRSDVEPEAKAFAVADILLAERLAPFDTTADATGDFRMDEAELVRLAGDFWNEEEGFAAETALEDGTLWAVHSAERRNELKPVGENRFVMLGVPARVVIEFDVEGGRVTGMRRSINGKPRGEFAPFQRRQASAEELRAYAGSFFSPELATRYRLDVADGRLLLKLAEVEPMELTPMFGETFEHPDWGAFEFERDAAGTVTGFRLQSGRVRNLAFSRD
jgi:CubicO group peptidase (beta-lactamase class C family)